MGDAIVAIIWVVFMIIAAISAIMKKAKQQQEMRERESTGEGAAKSGPVYAAPKEDIRAFLEQIGDKPQPARQPQRPRRKNPPKSAAKKVSLWDDQFGSDVSAVPKVTTVADTVTALTSRLSPIQRAVVWREILDSPPGLRAEPFAREA